MAVWSSVNTSAMSPDFRLDPEYYQPAFLKLDGKLTKLDTKPLGDTEGRFVVGPFGSAFNVENYVEKSPYRYIRGKDVKPFVLQQGDNVYIPERFFNELAKYEVFAGDLLVSVVGTLGNVALVTPGEGRAIFSCKSTVYRPADGWSPFAKYLVAYLNSDIGQSFLRRLPRGHIQTGLNLVDLKAIPIVLPTPSQQNRIAGTVDDGLSALSRAKQTLAEAEYRLLAALGLNGLDLTPSLCYSRPFKDLLAARRFDAEYFNPRHQRVLKRLAESGQTIGSVAELAERRFVPGQTHKGPKIRYIEIGSLTGDGQADAETIDITDAPSRARSIVEPGDIITSTVRPIRRLSALIGKDQKGHVCSSGFAVLRPKKDHAGIEPEVLLTYLRLPVICEIMDLHCTASMYPAIPVVRLLSIPIALPKPSVRAKIVEQVRVSIAARQESARLLDDAKRMVEEMVLGKAHRKGK